MKPPNPPAPTCHAIPWLFQSCRSRLRWMRSSICCTNGLSMSFGAASPRFMYSFPTARYAIVGVMTMSILSTRILGKDVMEQKITGRAYVLGDNIDTDQIIPAIYLKFSTTDPEERKFFGMYAMSSVPEGQRGLPDGNIPF